jgi:transcriptional regulator with XRE-family HTH domain
MVGDGRQLRGTTHTIWRKSVAIASGKGWMLRDLAAEVGVGFTYLSRVENERLNYGDYPSEALIHRLADALDADEDELLILAKRVPERIKQRVLQRLDAFDALAECDDGTLDKLTGQIGASFVARQVGQRPR